jgi:hypothetical protein
MKSLLLLGISSAILFLASTASAVPITYTITGVATGRLGTTQFTGAAYTITATADTSQIVTAGSFLSVLDETATIFISGVGTGTITVPFYTYDNRATSEAGFYYTTAKPGPGVSNTAFSAYGLASSIGPLSGTSTALSGISFNTTAGVFDPAPLPVTSFQATVPDQSPTLCLLGLGMFALAGFRLSDRITRVRPAILKDQRQINLKYPRSKQS